MKKIVILGSGAGGTMVASQLHRKLNPKEWQITIIDNDEVHHYQPGWLFIPFGVYSAEDCQKPKREFIPEGVDFVLDEVVDRVAGTIRARAEAGLHHGVCLVPEGLIEFIPEIRRLIQELNALLADRAALPAGPGGDRGRQAHPL